MTIPGLDQLRQKAAKRIQNSTELLPLKAILLSSEWEDDAEHLWWLGSAPIADIVDWANDTNSGESKTPEVTKSDDDNEDAWSLTLPDVDIWQEAEAKLAELGIEKQAKPKRGRPRKNAGAN